MNDILGLSALRLFQTGTLAASLLSCAHNPAPEGGAHRTVEADESRVSGERTIPPAAWPAKTYYRTVEVKGRKIFYREAGDPSRPSLLLLHGYPSSSHTYRELIPLLSGRFHVLAPDYLGSGYSDHPSTDEVRYTFDLLADYVNGFIEALKLPSYVLYMQDFGGPVGFRVAMAHPERLRAIVVQNANAYLDGLTPTRQQFFRRAHDDRSQESLDGLAALVSDGAIREKQYLRDVPGEKAARMSPDSWTHDISRLASTEDRRIQMALFQDYQNNIDAYPQWQTFLRENRPPTLIIWGREDPAFTAAGAEAYLRDVPDAKLHLLDAGHFAVEEQSVQVGQLIVSFMDELEHAPQGARQR